jgi:DNA-binding response OmpR family regulator
VGPLLVIEDSPAWFELLQSGELRAYELVRAASVEASLPLLQARPWAAILLDLHLPGTTGLDAVREVLAAHPPAPVIVVTGDERPDLEVEVIRLGAAWLVTKGRGRELPRVLRMVRARYTRRLAANEVLTGLSALLRVSAEVATALEELGGAVEGMPAELAAGFSEQLGAVAAELQGHVDARLAETAARLQPPPRRWREVLADWSSPEARRALGDSVLGGARRVVELGLSAALAAWGLAQLGGGG